MKIKIVLGLVAAAAVAGFVWEHGAVRQLQEDNAALQGQLAEQKAAPAPSAADSAAPEEIKRLREEHGELLQLRGEYSQWKTKAAVSSLEIEKLQNQLGGARQEVLRQAEVQAQETARRNTDAAATLARTAAVSQANECINNLVKINGAKEQWALENKLVNGAIPQDRDLFGPALYIAARPVCPAAGNYTLNAVGAAPTCSIAGHTLP
jgi:hypothetical protein